MWNVLRDLFNFLSSKSHTRLSDPTADEKRASLSQPEAIRLLLAALRTRENDPASEIQPISPWFGTIAILNIVAFLVLGIVIPWSLTGGLETAIVRARKTDGYIGFEFWPDAASHSAELADALFKQCWNNMSIDANPCWRMDGIFNDRPSLHVSRDIPCPFAPDVCHEDATPVQLEHINMSLRQFGINSKSRVLLNHRLTCSPLNIEYFLTVSDIFEGSFLLLGDFEYAGRENISMSISYFLRLSTRNGPNKYSNKSSGQIAARASRPYHLQIFPNSDANVTESRKRIHPVLRRPDGTVLVLGYRPGRSYYGERIDDPFYAAHDRDPRGFYFADHEITALGCVEQYQFCMHGSPDICTSWGGQQEEIDPVLGILRSVGDLDSVTDVLRFHDYLAHTATVQRYLLARQGTQSLLSSLERQDQIILSIDPKEQWVKKATAWFETAFLKARYGEFHLKGLAPPEIPEGVLITPEDRENFAEICNRILFFNGNYSNIDFIQLMIIVSCLMVSWLISFRHPITAGTSKIGKLCWWLVKQIIARVRTSALRCMSLIKNASTASTASF